jgi:hypothetical protein
MVVYGLAVVGAVVYRSGSVLRVRRTEDTDPVPLAWAAVRYGSSVAEDLAEKSVVNL